MRKQFEYRVGSKELQTRLLKQKQGAITSNLKDSKMETFAPCDPPLSPVESLGLSLCETESENSFIQSKSSLAQTKQSGKKRGEAQGQCEKKRRKRRKRGRKREESVSEEGGLKREFLKKFGLEFDSQVDKRIFVNYSDLSEYLDLINIKFDYVSRFKSDSQLRGESASENSCSSERIGSLSRNKSWQKEDLQTSGSLSKNHSMPIGVVCGDLKLDFVEEPNRWRALGCLRSPRSTITLEDGVGEERNKNFDFDEIVSSDEDFMSKEVLPELDKDRSDSVTGRADLEKIISSKKQNQNQNQGSGAKLASQKMRNKTVDLDILGKTKFNEGENRADVDEAEITTLGREILEKKGFVFGDLEEKLELKGDLDECMSIEDEGCALKENGRQGQIVDNIAFSLAGKSLHRLNTGNSSKDSMARTQPPDLYSLKSIIKQGKHENYGNQRGLKMKRTGTASTNTHASSREQTIGSKRLDANNMSSSGAITQDAFGSGECYDIFGGSTEILPEQIGSLSRIENVGQSAKKRFSEVIKLTHCFGEEKGRPLPKIGQKYSEESIEEINEHEHEQPSAMLRRPKRSIFSKFTRVNNRDNVIAVSEMDPMEYLLDADQPLDDSKAGNSQEELIDIDRLTRIYDELQGSGGLVGLESGESRLNTEESEERVPWGEMGLGGLGNVETEGGFLALPTTNGSQMGDEDWRESEISRKTWAIPDLSEPRIEPSPVAPVSKNENSLRPIGFSKQYEADKKRRLGSGSEEKRKGRSRTKEKTWDGQDVCEDSKASETLGRYLSPVISSERRPALVEKIPIQVNSLKKLKSKRPLKLAKKPVQSYVPKPGNVPSVPTLRVSNSNGYRKTQTPGSFDGAMSWSGGKAPVSKASHGLGSYPNQPHGQNHLSSRASTGPYPQNAMNYNGYQPPSHQMAPKMPTPGYGRPQNAMMSQMMGPKAHTPTHPQFSHTSPMPHSLPTNNQSPFPAMRNYPTPPQMGPTGHASMRGADYYGQMSGHGQPSMPPAPQGRYNTSQGFGYKSYPSQQQMMPGYGQGHYMSGMQPGFGGPMMQSGYYGGYGMQNGQSMPFRMPGMQRSYSGQTGGGFQPNAPAQRFGGSQAFAGQAMEHTSGNEASAISGQYILAKQTLISGNIQYTIGQYMTTRIYTSRYQQILIN